MTLGTSGAAYNLEDKPLNVNFAGDDSTANAYFVMDGFGDPYGQTPIANAVGNVSIQHLTPTIMCQQVGADALFLASERFSSTSAGSQNVVMIDSNIVIPNAASLWSGDSPYPMPPVNGSSPLPDATPMYVRLNDSVLAIRFLSATDTAGTPIGFNLVNDGGSYHACRISCLHSNAKPSGTTTNRIALHVRVADGLDDAGFARFRTAFAQSHYSFSMAGNRLTASAALVNGSMALVLDAQANAPITIGGSSQVDPSIIGVDGIDLGEKSLQSNGAPTSTPSPNAASSTSATTTNATPTSSGHGCGIGSGLGFLLFLAQRRMRSSALGGSGKPRFVPSER